MAKLKMHLRDPYVPKAPLCCVNPDLHLTDNPEQVTCGNCLAMMRRQREAEERKRRRKEKS